MHAILCSQLAVKVPKCNAGKVLARGADHTPIIFGNEPSCHLGMISIIRPAQDGLTLSAALQTAGLSLPGHRAGATSCSLVEQMRMLSPTRTLWQREHIDITQHASARA